MSADVLSLAPTPEARATRSHVTRWGGHEALLEQGYVAIPVVFLRGVAKLTPYRLKPTEALFIIQLMAFKWGADDPFPSYKTLADRMGITETYTRKLARSLEGKGFLVRRARIGRSNEFDLQPLFDQLVEWVHREQPSETAIPFIPTEVTASTTG